MATVYKQWGRIVILKQKRPPFHNPCPCRHGLNGCDAWKCVIHVPVRTSDQFLLKKQAEGKMNARGAERYLVFVVSELKATACDLKVVLRHVFLLSRLHAPCIVLVCICRKDTGIETYLYFYSVDVRTLVFGILDAWYSEPSGFGSVQCNGFY